MFLSMKLDGLNLNKIYNPFNLQKSMEYLENNLKNSEDKKQKMLELIKIKGPCLPAHLTRETGLNILITSAFLADLVSDKKLKITSMKIGGSPLYYINGQEPMLEKFYNYLPRVEKEAFLMLKEKQILKDKEMLPAIRVALRTIKDFAIPLKDKTGEIFWRIYTLDEQKAREIIEKKHPRKKEVKKIEKIKPKTEKPLLELSEPKIKKPKKSKTKQKSEFVNMVIAFLQRNNFEILEEINFKKKEYSAKIKINTQLGTQEYLCIAKDKKRVNDNDFRIAHQKGQNLKTPVLFISNGELNKKAVEWIAEWKNLLIFKKI